jgi:kynurenine 3-monooxygenase
MEKILIVGGGLVGSLLSIYLAKQGYEINLFDRYPDFRRAKAPAGRSINLTICERGFSSLDRVGAGDLVRAISVPCYGRMIHAVDGTVEFQPYGNRREALHSVSRNNLNRALLTLAMEQPSLKCHFQQKCVEVDLNGPAVTFKNLRTGETSEWRGDRLIGADGAHSAVRLHMQRALRFNFVQQYMEQGYKELNVPPTQAGNWALDGHMIHIWPRGAYMLIGFPNLDRSFTLSLHIPFEGTPSFSSLQKPEDVLRLFETQFPDALPLVPNLVEDFFGRPEASMVTIRCFPWTYQDKVSLIGDAAHAIVPSYGQGANSGFEDCAAFADLLAASGGDWSRALRRFEALRKPNADTIGDLALRHFIELRDLVGDPQFQLRKRIERRINELFPDRYVSLYNMVSFTNLPYEEALHRDREQRAVVEQLLEIPDILERLESEEIRAEIGALMDATGTHRIVPAESEVAPAWMRISEP